MSNPHSNFKRTILLIFNICKSPYIDGSEPIDGFDYYSNRFYIDEDFKCTDGRSEIVIYGVPV